MGNENLIVKLTEQELNSVVSTLKQIDVRGFDSMDRLVGLVLFFSKKKLVMEADNALEVQDNGTD